MQPWLGDSASEMWTLSKVFSEAERLGLEPVAIRYVAGVPRVNVRVGTPLMRPMWVVEGRVPHRFPCTIRNKDDVFRYACDWASIVYNVRRWKRIPRHLPETYFPDTLVDTICSVDTQQAFF